MWNELKTLVITVLKISVPLACFAVLSLLCCYFLLLLLSFRPLRILLFLLSMVNICIHRTHTVISIIYHFAWNLYKCEYFTYFFIWLILYQRKKQQNWCVLLAKERQTKPKQMKKTESKREQASKEGDQKKLHGNSKVVSLFRVCSQPFCHPFSKFCLILSIYSREPYYITSNMYITSC